MAHLFSRRWMIVLFVLLPLWVSLACNAVTGGSDSESSAPQDATVEVDVVFGPGDLIFPNTRAGLADLGSYKATLILSFDGNEAGQPSQWSKTYVMLTTKEPAARQLTIERTGNLPEIDMVFMAEQNGMDYERLGENACTANVIVQGNSLGDWLEPAGFLNGVHGAEAAGSETVNEITADHYTFDERAFGLLDIAQSTGEMWVASDGGYLLKYLLTTTGNEDYFGEGMEGTLTWDYEISDINQPLTLELPADCTAVLVNAPLLPDASEVVSVPGLLSFETSTTPAEVAAFYQEQFPTLGWVLLDEPVIGEISAFLEYEQGDQILSVIVKTDAGVTTVTLLLEHSIPAE